MCVYRMDIYIYIYIHVYVCVYIRVCMQPFLLAFEDRDISCPLSFPYVNMIQCRLVPWHPGGIHRTESWSHRISLVGRDPKDHLVPSPISA